MLFLGCCAGRAGEYTHAGYRWGAAGVVLTDFFDSAPVAPELEHHSSFLCDATTPRVETSVGCTLVCLCAVCGEVPVCVHRSCTPRYRGCMMLWYMGICLVLALPRSLCFCGRRVRWFGAALWQHW